MNLPLPFHIDHELNTPPFEQLRRQIIDRTSSGVLVPGTRLPPVRALAAEIGLAANTVARTYRELEEAGFVETRGRAGTFIKAPAGAVSAQAAAAAQRYAEEMRQLGIPSAESLAYAQAAIDGLSR